MPPARSSASVVTGRIRCRTRSQMLTSASIGTAFGGSHPRVTANSMMNRSASQKGGTDIPAKQTKLTAWSAAEYRSEEHTSELQSLMRIPYAVFCLKNKHNLYRHHTLQFYRTHPVLTTVEKLAL